MTTLDDIHKRHLVDAAELRLPQHSERVFNPCLPTLYYLNKVHLVYSQQTRPVEVKLPTFKSMRASFNKEQTLTEVIMAQLAADLQKVTFEAMIVTIYL